MTASSLSTPRARCRRSGRHGIRTRRRNGSARGRELPRRQWCARAKRLFCASCAALSWCCRRPGGAPSRPARAVYTSYATRPRIRAADRRRRRAAAADQPFQALEAYSGAIALRPDSMLAHLKRGRPTASAASWRPRRETCAAPLELDPTATLPLELLGDTNLSLERYDRAAERFQAYLALDDRSAAVWYKLGLARYRSGQAGQADTRARARGRPGQARCRGASAARPVSARCRRRRQAARRSNARRGSRRA